MTDSTDRRSVLATLAATIGTLAGCSGPGASGTATEAGPTDTGGDPTDDGTSTDDSGAETTGGTTTPELDLREANVVGVAVEESGDGRYDFDVTLYHDDEGEDGYANWWQVETLAGEQLGRRKLLHAHGTQEFTRSETIDVPSGHSCVVVRGHDQTHGYGGQAMLVNLESGTVAPKHQSSEKQSFAETDCP